MRYYCSYFDRNYLARALVLLESLERHESLDFRLIIICLDELTRVLLSKLQNKHLVLLARHDLEHNDHALIGPRQERSFTEYYWTLSPTAILRALDLVPEGEPLIYLDADLCFFSDPAPMLSELDGHSVLIHEHRFSPEFAQSEVFNGRFNVGLMGFRNDKQGRDVLSWWRERCNEWCFARTEDGKFGDQMYLNDWPTRFEGVRVLQHPGGGVAPWNQGALKFSEKQNIQGIPQLFVEGEPLVFFHFHALVPMFQNTYLLVKHSTYPLPELAVRIAYFPYVKRQEYWNDWLRKHIPALRFGYWPQQPLFAGAALLVSEQIAATIQNVEKHPLSDGWVLLPGTQVRPSKKITEEPQPLKFSTGSVPVTSNQTNKSEVIRLEDIPKISIITSVFDGDQFILPFLEDITRQTIFKEKCELILINANSPGSEEAVIFEFIKKFPHNIHYHRLDKDPGIYSCWNIAIKLATGEFLTNANLDDRKAPTFFAELARELVLNDGIDIVYADNLVTWIPNETWEFNTANILYHSEEFSPEAMLQGNPPHCMPMWRKTLHEKFGYFEEKYRSASDKEFWLRCVAGGRKAFKLTKPLGLYYLNPQGISTNQAHDSWKHAEEKEIFNKYAGISVFQEKPIIIDAVFFQMYQTGIARVWHSLLREWAGTEFGKRLIVLDRVGTAPRFEGLKYIEVPCYDYATTDADRARLQRICNETNAALFLSSYYTTPQTTPSVFMAYDMIPELFVAPAEVTKTPMWREKRIGVQHAGRFIAISQNTANDLRHAFPDITPDQISVAHCGTDFKAPATGTLAAFRKANRIKRPYFLLVGARDGYKNGILFFQAFAALGKARANYAIVCTGPTLTLEPEYASLVGKASVHMVQLNDIELQSAYAGALALIYPSLYEGFGMPVIEAMACGCPVITSRKGSLPEVAGDDVLYVDVHDVAGMTRALKDIQAPGIRARLVAAGRLRAGAYSWARMASEVQLALENAMTALAGAQAKFPQPAIGAKTAHLAQEQALSLAMQHHQAGQLEQAESIYWQILRENPGNFAAIHMLGVARYQRNDLALAEKLLHTALAMNSQLPEVHFNLGNVYAAQGRTAEARSCFTQAIALNQEFTLAHQQLESLNQRR
jgi:glycosyltransferase involved in cell wall biosynthesis